MPSPRCNQQIRRRRPMMSISSNKQSRAPTALESPYHLFKLNQGSAAEALIRNDINANGNGKMSPGKQPRTSEESSAPKRTPFTEDSAAAATRMEHLSAMFDLKADSLETKHSRRYLQRAGSISSSRSRFYSRAYDGSDEQDYSFITDKDSTPPSPLQEQSAKAASTEETSAADTKVDCHGVILARKISAVEDLSEYETDEDDVELYGKLPSMPSEEQYHQEENGDYDYEDDDGDDDYDDGYDRKYDQVESHREENNQWQQLHNNPYHNHNQQQQHEGVAPPEPLAPPALQMPPQQQQNGFGFNFEDFGNENIDMEAQEVGLEVRVALFDLLGLEGSLHIMFRNAVWLLGFITLFMLTLFSLPYLIGMSVATRYDELYKRYAFISFVTDACISLKTRAIYRSVQDFSSKYQNPILFFDITVMGIGFCTIFAVVFMLNSLLQAMYSYIPRVRFAIASISEVMNRLSIIVKVGLLLVVRIFILPILLGGIEFLSC